MAIANSDIVGHELDDLNVIVSILLLINDVMIIVCLSLKYFLFLKLHSKRLQAIVIPKVQSAKDIQFVSRMIDSVAIESQ